MATWPREPVKRGNVKIKDRNLRCFISSSRLTTQFQRQRPQVASAINRRHDPIGITPPRDLSRRQSVVEHLHLCGIKLDGLGGHILFKIFPAIGVGAEFTSISFQSYPLSPISEYADAANISTRLFKNFFIAISSPFQEKLMKDYTILICIIK
jgi:hypothetical protein